MVKQEDTTDRYLECETMYVLEDSGFRAKRIVTYDSGDVLKWKTSPRSRSFGTGAIESPW